MADITIQQGQGITQAIASNLGLSKADCKKIDLSIWQQVMTLVDQNNIQNLNNNRSTLFSGTNNVDKIGDKSSYDTNFLVHTGQKIQIEDGIWSKIKQLLTGNAAEVKTSENTQQTKNSSDVRALQVETLNNEPVLEELKPSPIKPLFAGGIFQSKAKSPVKQPQTPTFASSASEANIVSETPLQGDLKTGKRANELFNKMNKGEDVKVSVISDEIEALMAKPNKSSEDIKKINQALSDGYKKLGGSMTQFISSNYGDGSENISKEAFIKWQTAGLSEQDAKFLETSNNNLFARMDIDGDGKISQKEMSAFYYALDFDGNKCNGSIDTNSNIKNAVFLDDPNQNEFDAKLGYTYKALYGDE